MYRDPTEFRDRFAAYRERGIKAAYDCGKPLKKYDDGSDVTYFGRNETTGTSMLPEVVVTAPRKNNVLQDWWNDITNYDFSKDVKDLVYGGTGTRHMISDLQAFGLIPTGSTNKNYSYGIMPAIDSNELNPIGMLGGKMINAAAKSKAGQFILDRVGNISKMLTKRKIEPPMVRRTSAKQYYDWMNGTVDSEGNAIAPVTSLEDPNSAFIELRSHPDGHATVAQRHLVNKNGNDITFTFDRESPNLLLLEFDDTHGALTNGHMTPEEVVQAVNSGMWRGSEIAKAVELGSPRGLQFQNITPEQADLAIRFINSNKGKNVYVHCLRGTSRSGAFDKFLSDYYGYIRPEGKNVSGYSPEVYEALVDAYNRASTKNNWFTNTLRNK